MSAMVYLAHPIDARNDRQADIDAAAQYARTRLNLQGIWVFDPARAFTVRPDHSPDPRLMEVNYAALDRADGILALLPSLATSVGVPIEIERAARAGKTVVVWRDHVSWVLESMEGVIVSRTLPDAVSALVLALQRPAQPIGPRYTGDGQAPTQAYPDDVGYDLFAYESIDIEPGAVVHVKVEVAIEWPPGYWGLVVGRSSSLPRGLLVNMAVVDPGYRGPMFSVTRNIGPERVLVEAGDRIAQIVPIAAATLGPMTKVDQLSPTTRGTNGFGSSGR